MPEPSEEIQERRRSAFEEWSDDHPHLANALSGFVGGGLISIPIALAGEPAGTVVIAIVAVFLLVFGFCELVYRATGRTVMGTSRDGYTGDDPRTAYWAERLFGGGGEGGSGGDGGGGGGGGDGGGGGG